MADPRVDVVIVNYNGRDFLERLLPTLKVTRYRPFRIVVVDNASADGSVGWLRRHHPDVDVLARNTNDGFAVAANEGILRSKADAVALLNPDTTVPPDWLSQLVRAASSDSSIGIAAAIPLRTSQWSGPWTPPPGLPPAVQVSSFSAAAMLVWRRTWESIGRLDESMFLYWEDTEFCWRAVLRGFTVVLATRAYVHHESGGISRRSPEKFRIQVEGIKNELYTFRKILGPTAARSRARWFRLRAILRPWKNRHVAAGLRWYHENEDRIDEARRRDVGDPSPQAIERLGVLRRTDQKLMRRLRSWISRHPASPASRPRSPG